MSIFNLLTENFEKRKIVIKLVKNHLHLGFAFGYVGHWAGGSGRDSGVTGAALRGSECAVCDFLSLPQL